MYGLGNVCDFSSRDGIRDVAFGEVVHRTQPIRITIHYEGRAFSVVNCLEGPKEKGFMAKIKKLLVKIPRRMKLRDPY